MSILRINLGDVFSANDLSGKKIKWVCTSVNRTSFNEFRYQGITDVKPIDTLDYLSLTLQVIDVEAPKEACYRDKFARYFTTFYMSPYSFVNIESLTNWKRIGYISPDMLFRIFQAGNKYKYNSEHAEATELYLNPTKLNLYIPGGVYDITIQKPGYDKEEVYPQFIFTNYITHMDRTKEFTSFHGFKIYKDYEDGICVSEVIDPTYIKSAKLVGKLAYETYSLILDAIHSDLHSEYFLDQSLILDPKKNLFDLEKEASKPVTYTYPRMRFDITEKRKPQEPSVEEILKRTPVVCVKRNESLEKPVRCVERDVYDILNWIERIAKTSDYTNELLQKVLDVLSPEDKPKESKRLIDLMRTQGEQVKVDTEGGLGLIPSSRTGEIHD